MSKPTKITNDIRRLRFDADEMTQAELAKRIGVTRQTVLAIEQGRYSPVHAIFAEKYKPRVSYTGEVYQV